MGEMLGLIRAIGPQTRPGARPPGVELRSQEHRAGACRYSHRWDGAVAEEELDVGEPGRADLALGN